MSMTLRDYEAVAKAINQQYRATRAGCAKRVQLRDLTLTLADNFLVMYVNFNAGRFMAACWDES